MKPHLEILLLPLFILSCAGPQRDPGEILCEAAGVGDSYRVKALLGRGVSVNSQNAQGRTALMVAASGGHQTVILLLLKAGSEPDDLDPEGNSALMWAARKGQVEAAKRLLAAHADPNLRNTA